MSNEQILQIFCDIKGPNLPQEFVDELWEEYFKNLELQIKNMESKPNGVRHRLEIDWVAQVTGDGAPCSPPLKNNITYEQQTHLSYNSND
jgi:hypothetical protein